MNRGLGLAACIVAFGLTFAAGLAFMKMQQAEPEQARAEQAKEEKPKEEKPAPKPEEEPPPKKTEETLKPYTLPRAERPVLLKRWFGAAPAPLKGENEPSYENYFVREMSLDWSGSRVLTTTHLEAILWDSATGAALQTFKVATRTVPRKPPNKPDLHIDQQPRVSPGARMVALIDNNGKTVTFHDAASGASRVFRIPKDQECWLDAYRPEFSAGGDFLLLNTRTGNKDNLYAISTQDARGRNVDLGRAYQKQETFTWSVLIGLPRQSTIFRHVNEQVLALDLKTGKEKKVDSVSVKPWSLFENRGIKISPCGRYLSARGIAKVEVIDWKNDRLMMSESANYINNEWFTPDGTRLVLARGTDWIQYVNGRRTTPVGGWLDLWDIASGKKIATFRPDSQGLKDGCTTLAFSGDGTKFALGDHKNGIALIDFEMAFSVRPLPPAPQHQEREVFPWR